MGAINWTPIWDKLSQLAFAISYNSSKITHGSAHLDFLLWRQLCSFDINDNNISNTIVMQFFMENIMALYCMFWAYYCLFLALYPISTLYVSLVLHFQVIWKHGKVPLYWVFSLISRISFQAWALGKNGFKEIIIFSTISTNLRIRMGGDCNQLQLYILFL